MAFTSQLAIAKKYPSLQLYTHHLTLQHAQFAHWQHSHKFARALLRRHVASLSLYGIIPLARICFYQLMQITPPSSTSPHSHHYSTHLTLVSLALSANPVDLPSALHSLSAIQTLADKWGHPEINLLAQVPGTTRLGFDYAESFDL